MYYTNSENITYSDYMASMANGHNNIISCDWDSLRTQLLLQWENLTKKELDNAGPDRGRIAHLVESKYGVSAPLVENYLMNLERTLPVL